MPRLRPSERYFDYLGAALQLFVEQGVHRTTTDQIARLAGTAAGTLFLYFPTKQDLIDSLVLNISQEQAQFVKARLAPTLSARQTFQAIWEGSIQWFLEHPQAYLYVQQVRDARILSEQVVQESAKHLEYYFEAIQRGLQENAIQPYPPELIGGILYQQVVAVMTLLRAQPEPTEQQALIQTGFEIFWNGIKKG